jgi:hypothetical protein
MHRLLFVALMIADKIVEDVPLYNQVFADSAYFDSELVLQLELEFVKCLEYDLHVTGEEIEEVLEEWGFDCF